MPQEPQKQAWNFALARRRQGNTGDAITRMCRNPHPKIFHIDRYEYRAPRSKKELGDGVILDYAARPQ
jgi:hypothetical protein